MHICGCSRFVPVTYICILYLLISDRGTLASHQVRKYVNASGECFKIENIYDRFLRCNFDNQTIRIVGYLTLAVWIGYLLLAMGVASSKFFAPNLPIIAETLHMSENVAGETLMALGNGAPDLFTSLAAAVMSEDGKTGIGFLYGGLLGSGMFVTTVILGVVVAIQPFRTMERPLLRDLVFYLVGIYTAFATLWDGRITLPESLSFLIIYAVYLATVISASYVSPKFDKFVAEVMRSYTSSRMAKSSSIQSNNLSVSTIPTITTLALVEEETSNGNSLSGTHSEILTDEGMIMDQPRAEERVILSSSDEHISGIGEVYVEAIVHNSAVEPEVHISVVLQKQDTVTSVIQSSVDTSPTTVAVTESSRNLAVKRLQSNKAGIKSHSMKIIRPKPNDESDPNAIEQKLFRNLSLAVPRAKQADYFAGDSKKEEEDGLERQRSIPHAARFLIRSASNKERPNGVVGEKDALGNTRCNSIPVRKRYDLKETADIFGSNRTEGKRSNKTITRPEISITQAAKTDEIDVDSSKLDLNGTTSPDNLQNSIAREDCNGLTVVTSPVDIITSVSDSMSPAKSEEAYEKSNWRLLLDGLSPFDIKRMKVKQCPSNAIHVIRAPAVFFMLLTSPVVNEDKEMFNWNRPLNTLHCVTSSMFIVFAITGTTTVSRVPLTLLAGLLGIAVAIAVVLTSTTNKRPSYHTAFAFFGFLTTIAWIYTIAKEIISVLKVLALHLEISSTLLGMTCLAWGNSLGDLINNATIAKEGYPKMAISACYGGMVFNLLLGLGSTLTITTVKHNGVIRVQQSEMVGMVLLFLFWNIGMAFVVIPLFLNFKLKRWFAFLLFCVYGVFIICAFLVEFHLIHFNVFPR